jgi:hypothetical protein
MAMPDAVKRSRSVVWRVPIRPLVRVVRLLRLLAMSVVVVLGLIVVAGMVR